MGHRLTRFTEVSRSEHFEHAAGAIGYSEMGREIVKDFIDLGIESSTVESLAYRLADTEPPITGNNLSEYQRGVAHAMSEVVEREEAQNV